MDDELGEFIIEDVEQIAKNAIESTLQSTIFNHKRVNDWTNAVVDTCLKGLQQQLNKPFKYIVTCVIMQKTGAGMHTSVACSWDRKDGFCRVPWENNTMHCILTVYGLAI